MSKQTVKVVLKLLRIPGFERILKMAVRLGDTAPDFSAETTEGPINFHEWIGDDWAILFSHPRDFTPVCTTELGAVARLKPEFDRRGVKVLALSFPLVADKDREVALAYDMLDPTAEVTQTVRSVFVIDPAKKVRLTPPYPASTGRD